jgi:tryptophan synthase alpha chain
MSKIAEKFEELKKANQTAFMPFIVAGDPDFKKSLAFAKALAKNADFLEIGFPYSDPLADGPTIQAADTRALKCVMTVTKVFKLIREIRKGSDIPISVLVYANLVFKRGIEKFYRDAKTAGVNGVLIPDVPVEEAEPYVNAANKYGIDPIFLVTQTTTDARLKKILKHAKGHLYLVSVLGVTGKRAKFAGNTATFIQRIARKSPLPLAIGFGISKPEQGKTFAAAGVGGIIVGSALVDIFEKHGKAAALAFSKTFSARI